jgi:hypothetical protein
LKSSFFDPSARKSSVDHTDVRLRNDCVHSPSALKGT